MANTPNFALYKPSRADSGVEVDVSLTDNFVKIDTELKNNKDGLDTHKTDINAHASDKITHADGSVKTTLDNHEERLTSGEVAQADHETRISSNETTVADHETRITGVESKADDIDNRVTDIETLGLSVLAPNLEGRLATVESDVEGFLAPATFDAMDSQSYTFDEYRIGYVDSRLAQSAKLAVSIDKFPRLTGETDDTGRIQRAIQYAADNGINIVDFNAETYISGTIYPVSNTILRGKGIGSVNSGSTKITTIQLKNNANDNLIVGQPQVNNVQIQEMILDGNKTNQTGFSCGVYLTDSDVGEDPTWKLTNVRVRNFKNSGFYLGTNRRALKLFGCSASENDDYGILLKASDSVISRCGAFLNGKDGIKLDTASWVTVITECAIFSNTGYGIYTYFSNFGLIYGNGIDRNSKGGVYLGQASDCTTVLNNTIRSNSLVGDGLYPHVYVANGSSGVSVSNNAFGLEGGFTNVANYDIYLESQALITGIGNTRSSNASKLGVSNTPSRIMGNGRVFYGTAIPANGLVYNQGDIVENTSPSTGGNTGWRCLKTGKSHGTSTGNITNGSNVITSVTNTTTWSVGDNIEATTGIPFPATVTAVDTTNNTLTISGNAWATQTGVSLTDAKFVSVGIVGGTKLSSQTDSVAADVATLKSDFNALLAKLRTAGLM